MAFFRLPPRRLPARATKAECVQEAQGGQQQVAVAQGAEMRPQLGERSIDAAKSRASLSVVMSRPRRHAGAVKIRALPS
jgi:hypothetical protein